MTFGPAARSITNKSGHHGQQRGSSLARTTVPQSSFRYVSFFVPPLTLNHIIGADSLTVTGRHNTISPETHMLTGWTTRESVAV